LISAVVVAKPADAVPVVGAAPAAREAFRVRAEKAVRADSRVDVRGETATMANSGGTDETVILVPPAGATASPDAMGPSG
jgi:hypothetical protein